MPDANKLTALQAHGYKIATTCGFCIHSQFSGGHWGTCALVKYQHKKHSGTKLASVHASGTCPKAVMDPEIKETLATSGFTMFIE
jgi:hypothetical protein